MNGQTLKTLELDQLIDLLARRADTPPGRARASSLAPSTVLESINYQLDLTSECREYFGGGGAFGFTDVIDPTPVLEELRVEGASLAPDEILVLQRLISIGEDLRGQFNTPEARAHFTHLSKITGRLTDLRRVSAAIRTVLLPDGELDDNASPELRRVRRETARARSRIYGNLESLMKAQSNAVQEEIVTIRNGRFVIPIRTDFRGAVSGVVHGLSSSGQTTFVEPLAVIEQNNDLVRLREQEEIEIARILFEVSESLRANLPAMVTILDVLSEIDFTQAKARLAIELECVRPQMSLTPTLALVEARHPLLEIRLRRSGAHAVPVSFELDPEHQVMVISGPNAGGKTVAIKTAGLLALMAQMGLHVPAKEARLPVFQQIFADIGDQQSIAANLSTFTAHITNVAAIAKEARPPALVLLDEVGTGTDPDEGAALAVAIVDHFLKAGVAAIVSTHYNGLKMWASRMEGVLNASVEFDEQTLRPTYRLITGIAGASSGLEIARRMNLPGGILDEARTLLDPVHLQSAEYLKRLKKLVDDQESMTRALEEERQATAEKYATLDIEFARKNAERQRQFEAALAGVIQEFTDESERIIASVKDRVESARLRKETEVRRADMRRTAGIKIRKLGGGPALPAVAESGKAGQGVAVAVASDTSLVEESAEIKERDTVLIKSLARQGVVESISGDDYIVMVGSLRFRSKLDELKLVKPAAPPQSKKTAGLSKGTTADLDDIDQSFTSELNVIGNHVDEAIERVDKFLDEAYLAGAEAVRIIHGHGTGALRRAIAELLSGHPHVQKFEKAPQDQGGAGATLAFLKK